MTTVRRPGAGYEPHVDATDGRLTYSLPVDSGFVSDSFTFDLKPADLAVLLADPYRREMLAVIAHTVLQPTMRRGGPSFGQPDFARLTEAVLHAAAEDLERFADAIDRKHNIRLRFYVDQALARRREEQAD